jgi:hypothetical protein
VYLSSQYFRFNARAQSGQHRAKILERLVARADSSMRINDWRSDAFRILAPQANHMPGVGAAALFADCGAVTGRWACIATPVRYLAESSNVRLPADGIETLEATQAERLALDFNRVWSDSGARLQAGRCGRLYCIFAENLEVATRDPEEVLDRHIEEYLPAGADAPRLRRLMSEIEMWLFAHEEITRRTELGLGIISGLWLWGGGTLLDSLPPVPGCFEGQDVFFDCLSSAQPRPEDANRVIAVDKSPGGEAWPYIEAKWLKPVLAQLRSGAILKLELSAGAQSYTVTAGGSRRFWRRSRPWWESFR